MDSRILELKVLSPCIQGVSQKSLRYIRFGELVETAYQLTNIYLDTLPIIYNALVEFLDSLLEHSGERPNRDFTQNRCRWRDHPIL
jgi:hypothetical protein